MGKGGQDVLSCLTVSGEQSPADPRLLCILPVGAPALPSEGKAGFRGRATARCSDGFKLELVLRGGWR